MDFTKGEISKSIVIFSIPLILGNFFQQLYSLVNSAFVGNFLGVDELAAVGATYPVVFFITSMVLGIGSGGSVVVSHYYGAKDYESIHKIISTFYLFFIVLGFVICLLGIVFADYIFALLQLDYEVKNYSIEYFRIYMIGMFFSVIFHSAVSILRGLGDSTTQLWFLIPSNILNGILSYLFLGVFHWGIEASAWACVISQFLAFLSLFVYLHFKHEFVKLPSLKNLFFDKKYLKDIVNIGIPTGFQQSIVSLTQILILFLVARFGTDATAAYSCAYRIDSIALLFVLNISQSLTSFVGTNIGAEQVQRTKLGLKSSLKIMLILSCITLIIFCFCNDWLMRLFTQKQSVIDIGKEYLTVTGICWILFGVMMMFTAFFRGLGFAFITMIISFVSLWVVRFPISWYLSDKIGTLGIWLGAPFAWLSAIVFYITYYKKSKWYSSKIVKTLLAFVLLSVAFACSNLYSQTSKPKYAGIFDNPLHIPITSTGSFAELRGSHFHSGLDIRTKGKTGFNVYAPADGYVSRIKVQAFGGGKNLYITHPNGYTTVYMHLEKYAGEIEKFVKDYQYSHKCYEFDHTFTKPSIYVKRGDIIAISGESGMVAGPHLHFEVRKTKTENPLNPLLFIDVKDTIAPYISSIAISPDNNSSVENSLFTKIIPINHSSLFKEYDTINACGNIYFSILAYDPSIGSSMKNGVLKTELFIDSVCYFTHQINEFSFANFGFVDAIINYPLYVKTGNRYLCSKQKKNGKLPYNTYYNNGMLNVKTDSIYKVTWKLSDIKNNTKTFSFFVKGVEDENLSKPIFGQASVKHFDCLDYNSYTALDSSVFIFPKNSLYQDIDFKYSVKKGTFSNVHTLHSIYEPVKKSYTIKIKPYKIDNSLLKKYLLVKIDSKGHLSSIGGFVKDGFVESKSGSFGSFAVWIDTIAPTIKALNFKNNAKIPAKLSSLQMKITDNLSGIMSYNAYLNNEWVLMEYDGKKAKLTLAIDNKLKSGANTLKIVVTDKKNNTKTEVFTILH